LLKLVAKVINKWISELGWKFEKAYRDFIELDPKCLIGKLRIYQPRARVKRKIKADNNISERAERFNFRAKTHI